MVYSLYCLTLFHQGQGHGPGNFAPKWTDGLTTKRPSNARKYRSVCTKTTGLVKGGQGGATEGGFGFGFGFGVGIGIGIGIGLVQFAGTVKEGGPISSSHLDVPVHVYSRMYVIRHSIGWRQFSPISVTQRGVTHHQTHMATICCSRLVLDLYTVECRSCLRGLGAGLNSATHQRPSYALGQQWQRDVTHHQTYMATICCSRLVLDLYTVECRSCLTRQRPSVCIGTAMAP